MKILLIGNSVARAFPAKQAQEKDFELLTLIAPNKYWVGTKRNTEKKTFGGRCTDNNLIIENSLLMERFYVKLTSNIISLADFDIVICGLPHFYNFTAFKRFCNIENLLQDLEGSEDLVKHSTYTLITSSVYNEQITFCKNLIEASKVPVYFLESAPGNYYYDRLYPELSKYFLLSRKIFFNSLSQLIGIDKRSVIDIYLGAETESAEGGQKILRKEFSRVPDIGKIEDDIPTYISPYIFDLTHPIYSAEFAELAFEEFLKSVDCL